MSYLKRAHPAQKRLPDEASKKHPKKYENVGRKSVHDLPPGEVGELSLTEGQALALVQAGLLVEVEDLADDKSEKKDEKPLVQAEEKDEEDLVPAEDNGPVRPKDKEER